MRRGWAGVSGLLRFRGIRKIVVMSWEELEITYETNYLSGSKI